MARRGAELDARRLLTFGGRAPFSVGVLLLVALVLTLVGSFSPPLGSWLVLQVPDLDTPSWVVAFQAWRLVSWSLYQGPLMGSLLTLVFAGYMLVWLGQQLSYAWSEKRFLWRCLGLAVGSAAITLLLLTPFGVPVGYFGLWPVVNALLATWGLIFPNQQLSWFGAVQMRGATVAKIITVATPVWALLTAPPRFGLLHGLVLYVPPDGRHLLVFAAGGEDDALAERAFQRLLRLPRGRGRRLLTVERIDGVPVRESRWCPLLLKLGFTSDYRGLSAPARAVACEP